MISNDLYIEKLYIDVFADNQSNSNAFLYELSNAFQQDVLKVLEEQLDSMTAIYPAINLTIDRLDIDFKETSLADWKIDLANQITNQIRLLYEQQLMAMDDFESVSNHTLSQLFHFYQFGIFKASNHTDLLNSLEKIASNDEKWADIAQNIVNFVKNDDILLRRFLAQHSTSFIQKIFQSYFSDAVMEFLMSLNQLKINTQFFSVKIIQYLLNEAIFQCAMKAENFEVRFNTTSTEFIELMLQLENMEPEIYKKHEYLIQNWTNQSHLNKSDELSDVIKEKTTLAVYKFIEQLRSDQDLKEKLDPFLKDYFLQNFQSNSVEEWISKFASSIQNASYLRDVLMELEELKLAHLNPKEVLIIKVQVNKFIAQLELQLADLDEKGKQQLKGIIFIDNAGIILLNPFLPSLFKNLDLQTEKGEWRSKAHQEWAIYLLHYLATENFDATENQLFLAKILTGYPLDEVLQPFENGNENYADFTVTSLKKLVEIELPNILETIHQNWRPMRNCTWHGLRNDFLSRNGNLVIKENLQYILTIQPNTLDVLLPHIKWGFSWIKYSWMEEILYAGWE